MKTISMDYVTYQNDLSAARINGARDMINTLREAMDIPDDGSRFDFLVTELEELGVSLARSMKLKEPVIEEDVPF